MLELKSHDVDNGEFACKADSYRMGQAVLGRHQVSGHVVQRVENRLKVEREDLIVLRMPYCGYSRGVMNDAGYRMQPDRFTLFDFHQNMDGETRNIDFISLTLPYSAVGYDPSLYPGFLHVPMNAPVGRVLRSNLEMILGLAPRTTPDEARTIADGLAGFLRGVISKDLREDTVFQQSSRFREIAVRRFVAENLRSHDLGADKICQAAGVSRPVLYRMYEADGGVGRAILRMRLTGLYEELAAAEPKRGAVSRIARSWGFSDQSHFARLFRNEFGITASDVLASAHASHVSGGPLADSEVRGRQSQNQKLLDLFHTELSRHQP
ncbi:helix-turn-helix domain-containing protein [Gymnodinialimonas sp.]